MENSIEVTLAEINGKLDVLSTKVDERQSVYMKSIEENKRDISAAFEQIRRNETDLTKNSETTGMLAARVEKLERMILEMRDTLIKVSVVATLMTAGLTALIMKFFGE